MNRALAAKAERAKRQRRERAHIEYSKPCYVQPKTRPIAPPDGVVVTLCEVGRYTPPEGKRHATLATTCYGDGTRRNLTGLIQPTRMDWVTFSQQESTLIARR